MPLSILHPQKDYTNLFKKNPYSCVAGITSCFGPDINLRKVSEFSSLLSTASSEACFCKVEARTPPKGDWLIQVQSKSEFGGSAIAV